MKYKPMIFIAVLAVFLLAIQGQTGTVKRQGTAGGMELLLPVGSAGTALGGNCTAGISGVEAIYWNPAGISASTKSAEMLVSRMRYIADIDVNYVAIQAKLGKVGNLAASFKSLNFGEIPVTTEYATDGTGEYFSPSFVVVGASYSRAMTDRIYFGATTKIVSEQIENVSATAVGFDFGVQYNTRKGLKLGVALRNLGSSLRFNGSDLERRVHLPGHVDNPVGQAEDLRIVAQSAELPTTMDIGLSYTYQLFEGNSITLMGNFQNYQFGYDKYGTGLEYRFQMDKVAFALRGAVTAAHDVDNGKLLLQKDNYPFGPSFGGELFYQAAPQLSFTVQYAYRKTKLFSDNQWVSLIVGF